MNVNSFKGRLKKDTDLRHPIVHKPVKKRANKNKFCCTNLNNSKRVGGLTKTILFVCVLLMLKQKPFKILN